MSSAENRQVVVGAAILDADLPHARVLATQRATPPSLAGMWEFPGGKVESGETEVEALVRECQEELGVLLEVGGRVGPDVATADGVMTLRVYLARVAGGRIELSEHSDARWLSVDALGSVRWVAADHPIVDSLRSLLASGDE